MFILCADKNKLTVRQREPVTSGSVNIYQVQFQFSDDWEGLARTAVFRAGHASVSMLLDWSNQCTVPWEVLGEHAYQLNAGVYGTRDGEEVLPTIWASLGTILEGTAPGEAPQPPTPDVYKQMLDQLTRIPEPVEALTNEELEGLLK